MDRQLVGGRSGRGPPAARSYLGGWGIRLYRSQVVFFPFTPASRCVRRFPPCGIELALVALSLSQSHHPRCHAAPRTGGGSEETLAPHRVQPLRLRSL